MRVLALMYHRAQEGRHGNSPEMLDAHFAHVARHCACVMPGEPLDPQRLNVCLSFDDGYFDFYAVIFPRLKKHGLRALLAVPPLVVPEESLLPAASRLRAVADMDFGHPPYDGFCTWRELREMAQSGHVDVAAHGFTHRRLDRGDVDLDTEIAGSKVLLAARLGRPVENFVFPYGRFSPAALQWARESYRHVFRIGGADNPGWNRPLLYRVNADAMESPGALFTGARLLGYRMRYLWNRARGR